MLRWPKIKFIEGSFSGLHGDQAFQSFEDIIEEEVRLLETISFISQSCHSYPQRSPSLMSEAPIDSPYISPRYSPLSYVSSPPSATIPPISVENDKTFSSIRVLDERMSYFKATIIKRVDEIEARLTVIEERVGGQKSPIITEAAGEGNIGAATEGMHPEVFVKTTSIKDEQLIEDKGQTPQNDVAHLLVGSIACVVKARQVKKRKMISSPFTRGERKKRSAVEPVGVATSEAESGEIFVGEDRSSCNS